MTDTDGLQSIFYFYKLFRLYLYYITHSPCYILILSHTMGIWLCPSSNVLNGICCEISGPLVSPTQPPGRSLSALWDKCSFPAESPFNTPAVSTADSSRQTHQANMITLSHQAATADIKMSCPVKKGSTAKKRVLKTIKKKRR